MKTLNYIYVVFCLFLVSCSSRIVYLRSDNSQPVNYEGIYESGDGFNYHILRIEKGNRFVESGWSDIGGTDSTIGRWEETNTLGIIKLYSDKIPIPNIFDSDSSFRGYKIVVNENFYDTLDFVTAEIGYNDTTIYCKPNSDGIILLSNKAPRYIKVFNYPDYYHCIHIIDTADCNYSLEWGKKKYGVDEIISCGKPFYNIIKFTMQKKYWYNNGDVYFLYNDQAYSLKYGLIKLKY